MTLDLKSWSEIADQQITIHYRKVLTATTVDEFLCWHRVLTLWRKIKLRIDTLIERFTLQNHLLPLSPDDDLQAETNGLWAAIRAAVTYASKPEPGSPRDNIAMAWQLAADAYFSAVDLYESGRKRAGDAMVKRGNRSAEGARQSEETHGEVFVPLQLLPVKLPILPDFQPIDVPKDTPDDPLSEVL